MFVYDSEELLFKPCRLIKYQINITKYWIQYFASYAIAHSFTVIFMNSFGKMLDKSVITNVSSFYP